ncbi:PREDICTED: ribonuclease 2-like [Ipomoea nil]|uniref:ribonuclease 2-like n=1 Tax=Ipomoea nil TaxID=35883 RepID=UPI0009012E7E|nr:PREDICTED: ribonuclease 2-like [Ipomoea nil]
MASLPAKLILSLLLLLGIAAAPLKAQTLKPKPKKEFDYFTLSLSWSGTRCLNVKECCPTNGCCNPDIGSEFTIRGFWPDYNDGTWPACCNGTTFNENDEIAPIMRHLERYWPSYYCTLSSACGSPKGSIWAYEWVKHGTCASPVLSTQYTYFSTVLLFYATLDVTGTLSRSGYVASDSAEYPLEGITSAIKNAYRATPVVSCYGNAVKEVQLCFNKTLVPQDCPTTESGMLSKSSSGECPSIVTLPIKNVTPAPEKMNHLSFRGVLNS